MTIREKAPKYVDVKVLVDAFNQEKAIVGAFSAVIVKLQSLRRFV